MSCLNWSYTVIEDIIYSGNHIKIFVNVSNYESDVRLGTVPQHDASGNYNFNKNIPTLKKRKYLLSGHYLLKISRQ